MSLVQEHHFKRAAVCQALGLARSTSYAESEAQQTTEFDAVLREEAGKHPRAGSRMLSVYLKRRGVAQSGRTRVRTAMQRLGIIHICKRRIVRTTNSRHGFERYYLYPFGTWFCVSCRHYGYVHAHHSRMGIGSNHGTIPDPCCP
jgi:hypothetical protein